MHSLSLILVLLIAFGVHAQVNDNDDNKVDNIEKGYPFGKLRILEDGKTEELIASNDIEVPFLDKKSVDTPNIQPLQTPCAGSQSLAKIPYPKDKTKYIFCRDEFHYEILTCPDGVEFNEETNTCDISAAIPSINRCELEKPCLNEGTCSTLSNSTFKCTCRPNWTGERCETPLNSCVKKPCGPNAECRPLTTDDYEQDYVCVCHSLKGYGLNCREAVPNPCLTTTEQFYPFAFSQRAYIHCDGEMIFFQPCSPSLYWNPEEKICDRQRPPKMTLPVLLTKVTTDNSKNRNHVEIVDNNNDNNDNNELIATTPKQIEQEKPSVQTGKQDKDPFGTFIPARVANRQQLLATMNNQQTQNFRENEQNSQMTDDNQVHQNSFNGLNKWQSPTTNNDLRRPLTVQPNQNQFSMQNTQQQWSSASTQRTFVKSNMDESNFERTPQQNFQQKNQAFGTKQWLDQLQDVNTQNNQRFATQPQLQRTSQNLQNQEQFSGDDDTPSTDFPKPSQNTQNLQGFQRQNSFGQGQTWQNKLNPIQSTGNQFTQTSQNFQNLQSQQDLSEQSFIETTTQKLNTVRLQGFGNKNSQIQEQSWKQQPKNIVGQSQSWQNLQPSETESDTESNLAETTSLNNQNRFNTGFPQTNQRFVSQPSTWQEKQNLRNQQQFPVQNQETFLETTTKPQWIAPSQNLQSQQQSWSNRFQTQNQPNAVELVTKFDDNIPSQGMTGQEKTWQNQFPVKTQETILETTTKPQWTAPSQGFQGQVQPWQNKFTNQQQTTPPTQVFAFKPTHWTETPKQEKTFSSQSRLLPNQQSLNTGSSFQKQNTQFELPQQQQDSSLLNTVGKTNQWSNNRVLNVQPTQTQFESQNKQMTGNTFETANPSTNKGINQGIATQNFRGQTSSQTVDPTQFQQNDQQTISEQQKRFEAPPPKVMAPWSSRQAS